MSKLRERYWLSKVNLLQNNSLCALGQENPSSCWMTLCYITVAMGQGDSTAGTCHELTLGSENQRLCLKSNFYLWLSILKHLLHHLASLEASQASLFSIHWAILLARDSSGVVGGVDRGPTILFDLSWAGGVCYQIGKGRWPGCHVILDSKWVLDAILITVD